MSCCGVVLFTVPLRSACCFTAVKRKKLLHFRSFRTVKFESVQRRGSYENDAENVLTKRISPRQNLWMSVTSFYTHTQRKKLKFTETALSFADKVKLSTFVFIFLCKIMVVTAQALYV